MKLNLNQEINRIKNISLIMENKINEQHSDTELNIPNDGGNENKKNAR